MRVPHASKGVQNTIKATNNIESISHLFFAVHKPKNEKKQNKQAHNESYWGLQIVLS
jgi:hypothetical protein